MKRFKIYYKNSGPQVLTSIEGLDKITSNEEAVAWIVARARSQNNDVSKYYFETEEGVVITERFNIKQTGYVAEKVNG